jgi:hypothetical protein
VLHPAEGYGLRDVNCTLTKHNDGRSRKSKDSEEDLNGGGVSDEEMPDEGLFTAPIDESRRVVLKSKRKGHQPRVKDLEALS